MKPIINIVCCIGLIIASHLLIIGCVDPNDDNGSNSSSEDFVELLDNQADIVINAMLRYQSAMNNLVAAIESIDEDVLPADVTVFEQAYSQAYLTYQAAAVHNYFATANSGLVESTNLYPIDVDLLEELIANESYNFSNMAQQRANGFPALDYMIYNEGGLRFYLLTTPKSLEFLNELVHSMSERADALVEDWTGALREDFINNGGTALGSSISEQLNKSLIYLEDHVRENKVGIPIGLLGPNDSPIPADSTKIEAYYQSVHEGNSEFALQLLSTSINEMQTIYLGFGIDVTQRQGYDDLLLARDQSGIHEDIVAQFSAINLAIIGRENISGDDELYQDIQGLITLYKSDLFPVLNVQDADGATDGD